MKNTTCSMSPSPAPQRARCASAASSPCPNELAPWAYSAAPAASPAPIASLRESVPFILWPIMNGRASPLKGARAATGLDSDHLTVLRGLELHLIEPRQHLLAHVREHDPVTLKQGEVLGERPVVEMARRVRFEEVAFAHEQVEAARDLEQDVGPLGVAGVRYHLAAVLDSERIRRRAATVLDPVGADHGGTALAPLALDVLDESQRERQLLLEPTGIQRLEHLAQPLLAARRPHDRERTGPLREAAFEDQPGQTAEVVAVQVGEHDPADARRIDPRALERDERGRTTVDQQRFAAAVEVQAALKAAASSERVAAAEKPELDRGHRGRER